MSEQQKNPSGPRGPLKVPKFEGEVLEFAETILSIGMPYKAAVQAFVEAFPAILESDELSEAEIYEIVENRLRRMRKDTRRLSYQKIKETEASLKKLLDCIPVASPLIRLIELEQMRQDPSLKPGDRIKVLAAAVREEERLTPRERTSPFSGLPNLPGLPTASETSETSENTENAENKESPPSDPFGGAMMSNVNTGQKKP